MKVDVDGRKLAYTVHFTYYKAAARSTRQLRDRKWRHVTSAYQKWPGRDLVWPKVTWKWLRRPKTCVCYAFHFLQGCTSQ